MNDCSTREFIFDVSPLEVREGDPGIVNAFSILRDAQNLGTMVPPPRVTKDNATDDNLHIDILRAKGCWMDKGGGADIRKRLCK